VTDGTCRRPVADRCGPDCAGNTRVRPKSFLRLIGTAETS
jgi:hypothetical protein